MNPIDEERWALGGRLRSPQGDAQEAVQALREAARLRRLSEAQDYAGARAWRRSARDELAVRHAWALVGPMLPAGSFVVQELLPEIMPDWRARLAPKAAPAIAPLLPAAALECLLWAARLDHVVAAQEAQALGLVVEGVESAELGSARVGALLGAGAALGQAAHDPACRIALVAMSLPARLAGLSELQGFLERGMRAFRALPDPKFFLSELGRLEGLGLKESREVLSVESTLPPGSKLL